MGLSILHNLLDIRGKLFSSIDNQDKALATITGLSDSLELFSGTIADGVGNILKVESDTATGMLTITQTARDGVSELSEVFSGSIQQLREAWDGAPLPAAYSDAISELKNFSYDAAQSQSCNEVMTTLIEKYTTNVKAKAVDLSAIIDSSSLSSADASRFKSAINAASDSDGYLSNYAFLGVIKSFLDSGKSSLEDGGITLDESSPVYLSHLLGTAFLAILSSLASFIGSCLQWVNLLIGTIVAAIGWIAETVLSRLSAMATTDIQIKDPMASTFWFEAPSIGCRYQWTSVQKGVVPSGRIESNAATYRDINGYATLYWLDSNDNTKMLINEYPSVMYDVNAMKSWVANHVKLTISINDDPEHPTDCLFVISADQAPGPQKYFTFMDQFKLDDAGLDAVLSSSNEDLANYFFDQMRLCAVLDVVRSTTEELTYQEGHFYDIYEADFDGIISSGSVFTPGDDWSYHFDHVIKNLVEANGDQAAILIAFATQYLLQYMAETSTDTDYTWYKPSIAGLWDTASKRASYFTQFMICRKQSFDIQGILGYITNYQFHASAAGSDFYLSVYPKTSSPWTARMYRHSLGHLLVVDVSYDPIHGTYTGRLSYKISDPDDISYESKLSSIPESRMFKYANADLSNVITALVLVSAVFAVTLCVGSVCARAMKRHSWKKQYTKKRQVKQAAATYEKNPTQANLDALYKAQKSYNFKAKMFGWDSFDATNMWFNDSSSASTGSNSMDLTSISKLIKG